MLLRESPSVRCVLSGALTYLVTGVADGGGEPELGGARVGQHLHHLCIRVACKVDFSSGEPTKER